MADFFSTARSGAQFSHKDLDTQLKLEPMTPVLPSRSSDDGTTTQDSDFGEYFIRSGSRVNKQQFLKILV